MKGLTGHKGRVHITVGGAMNASIEEMRLIQHKNDKVLHLANAIDAEMHRIYKLWPTNYIAYDLMHGIKEHKEHYNNIQKITFTNYLRGRIIGHGISTGKFGLTKDGYSKTMKEILLEMYANPVANKIEVLKKKSENLITSI
jgi:hypothetical protein